MYNDEVYGDKGGEKQRGPQDDVLEPNLNPGSTFDRVRSQLGEVHGSML